MAAAASVEAYHKKVLATLSGQDVAGVQVPPEQLDWQGTSGFLELFDRASGAERHNLIEAIRRIIQDNSAAPGLLGELVHLCDCLSITEVAPEVQALRKRPLQEPLRSAVNNFLSNQELALQGNHKPAERRGATPGKKHGT